MTRMHIILFLLAAMGCALMGPIDAMSHIVGGSFGWDIPNNASFYQEWAKPRTFGVGDKLVFPYRMGVHNVIEVSKKDFEECTMEKVVDMYHVGPLILELPNVGDRYFFCGVGTHCEAGQKLGITVTNAPGSAGDPIGFEAFPVDAPVSSVNTPPETKSSANSTHNFGVIASLISFFVSLFI